MAEGESEREEESVEKSTSVLVPLFRAQDVSERSFSSVTRDV